MQHDIRLLFDKYFEEADADNKKLAEAEFPLGDYKNIPGYNEALNIGTSDIMGYITIRKLDVIFPQKIGV